MYLILYYVGPLLFRASFICTMFVFCGEGFKFPESSRKKFLTKLIFFLGNGKSNITEMTSIWTFACNSYIDMLLPDRYTISATYPCIISFLLFFFLFLIGKHNSYTHVIEPMIWLSTLCLIVSGVRICIWFRVRWHPFSHYPCAYNDWY